jgi:hypothetical protein
MWWSEAATGTIPNIIIAIAVVLGDRVGLYPDAR